MNEHDRRIDEPGECCASRKHSVALVGILLLGTLYRIGICLVEPYPQEPPFQKDAGQYHTYAHDLATGADYTVGDENRTSPRSKLPPLYPLFLAAFMASIGFQSALIFIVQNLLSIFVIWATYYMARRVLPPSPSLLAALFVAIFPAMAGQANQIGTEAIYTPLLALTVVLSCLAYDRDSLKWALAAGVCCGATMLSRNVALLLPAALVACFLIKFQIRRAIGLSLCLALGCAIAFSPWWAHNYSRYGSIRPAQVSQGTGMFTAYAVLAHYGFAARPSRVPMAYDDPEAERERYMELVWKPAHTPGYVPPVTARYFLSHPMDYVHQTWWRFFQCVKPTSQSANAFKCEDGFGEYLQAGRFDAVALKLAVLGLDTFLVFGALAGTVLAIRRFRKFVPFLIIGGYFLVLHTFVHATVRYRYPVIPVLAVLAVFALNESWQFLKDYRRRRQESRAVALSSK